jgi:hypothetical protein
MGIKGQSSYKELQPSRSGFFQGHGEDIIGLFRLSRKVLEKGWKVSFKV